MGLLILIVFLLMFTLATILVPIPLFPGNVLCSLIEIPLSESTKYLSALINGAFYGLIAWFVFILITRNLVSER
jgi:hypothetical protein